MKGICFIEPLSHKVVKGEKTQTRRIIPEKIVDDYYNYDDWCLSVMPSDIPCTRDYEQEYFMKKHRYSIGEIVYLKEPYYTHTDGGLHFKYDGREEVESFLFDNTKYEDIKWKNKLFMPASAARYFIEITAVRVERLQDISAEDCMKEGIEMVHRAGHAGENNPSGLCFDISQKWDYQYSCSESAPWKAYAALINKINGKDTWEKNPWVWVYDFKLINIK